MLYSQLQLNTMFSKKAAWLLQELHKWNNLWTKFTMLLLDFRKIILMVWKGSRSEQPLWPACLLSRLRQLYPTWMWILPLSSVERNRHFYGTNHTILSKEGQTIKFSNGYLHSRKESSYTKYLQADNLHSIQKQWEDRAEIQLLK